MPAAPVALAEATLAAFPELRPWLAPPPELTVVEQADAWERVLAVLAWFRDHPPVATPPTRPAHAAQTPVRRRPG